MHYFSILHVESSGMVRLTWLINHVVVSPTLGTLPFVSGCHCLFRSAGLLPHVAHKHHCHPCLTAFSGCNIHSAT